MKNVLKILPASLLLACLVSGCDELLSDNCAECCVVTYDENSVELSRDNCVEYCDQELDDIESQSPVTVGNRTTQYECN